MIGNAIRKVFGTANDRYIKSLQPLVERTNALEDGIKKLSDPELAAQTARFRERLERGESLDDLIPEIFATVREVAWRTVDMRPFDVQIVGGAVLHAGKIAEMKTGEGKTLVATLPLYANALQGQGAHLVTVNDYLARRDAAWMGPVYNFLGLSVGVVTTDMDEDDRYKAYRADITYGQNNEFGFDYLRDNMKFDVGEFVQGELAYGIVDEVDSILIDEARTPLIISGPAEDSTEKYYSINRIIPRLNAETDFTVDEKLKATTLTEEGVAHIEKILGIDNLYDPEQIEILHHVNQALKAHALFKRDVDYMIDDGQVVIVDEFTGRLMTGRRWSDGLHQAVEAKEGVTIERENQTLATVTFQNYFRMYDKLSGMTGTADTEAAEFRKIYNLDVAVVPTNQDMLRQDFPDVVYRSEREKFEAVIEEIQELNERGQPVLVGTISIENSEKLSALLKKTGVKHHVLNAKHHASEAEIVSQAGRKGAVTISTNMAGRGTDIVLGGNPTFLARNELGEGAEKDGAWESSLQRYVEQCEAERGEVIEAGGLHILGTERHESRRIDNQLRGRSGRQGDPGSSRFYMSLQDDLLRIFGAERIDGLMGRLGMEEGVPIEAKMVSRAIESAQQKVEGHNFDIRKHLLEYDDVMNQQREIVYGRRREYLSGGGLKGSMVEMAQEAAAVMVANHAAADDDESYDWKGLDDVLFGQFRLRLDLSDQQKGSLSTEALSELTTARVAEAYDHREVELGNEVLRHLERVVTLQSIDSHWKDHLLAMDHLKEGIGLRGYGQRNPLQEYQREGFDMFAAMLERFESDVLEKLYSVRVAAEEDVARMEERQRSEADRQVVFDHAGPGQAAGPEPAQQIKRSGDKVGRNDPCPCGSGKKYKKCHGR